MCVNSPLGNARTYISVDVVRWVRAHFRVPSSTAGWAIGGYSEGATCAVQFTADKPHLFGTTLAVASELAPTMGPQTISRAFGGSTARYHAATPLAMFRSNGPFPGQLLILVAGQLDTRYRGYMSKLSESATAGGLRTRTVISPHSGHDFNTVSYALEKEVPIISVRLGL